MELASKIDSTFLNSGDFVFRVGTPNEEAIVLIKGSVYVSRTEKMMGPALEVEGFPLVARSSSQTIDPPVKQEMTGSKGPQKLYQKACRSLQNHDFLTARAVKTIQNSWRQRRKKDVPTFTSRVVTAPSYFGEACLMTPYAEWTSTPPLHLFTAQCETICEYVRIPRSLVKEVVDRFSPWLLYRFEIFLKSLDEQQIAISKADSCEQVDSAPFLSDDTNMHTPLLSKR